MTKNDQGQRIEKSIGGREVGTRSGKVVRHGNCGETRSYQSADRIPVTPTSVDVKKVESANHKA
ncbi:hypothetical protein [Gordonibacter massiliensis (ex Traore et al. 2017)]|uniref:Uncharacterized protein n=1 Tax=Gordonibacter massiliensis (ex Traore et al. 2017) TaxID=1841863 RepID=A0A842JCG8_9ACTN|nr:hypothetical protein [Gordonibacter massiliensis (ex Traore et al. 2017)]MBC2888191.1 hypothetical protein [Gordonibacter massiliensis (ex Traore et al. 2017)]